MTPRSFRFWLGVAVCFAAWCALAQPTAAVQDSTLDNLVLDAGYQTAPLGSLGAVVERGEGPEMVLVSGFGVGSSAFDGFMQRNRKRYHMLAITLVDGYLAPRWFKTVTRQTWVTNNFVATDYSADESRGKRCADRANDPPLPVLIRYLCEFHASDVRAEVPLLTLPLLVIQPSFTPALRADPKRSYLASFFTQPWQGILKNRPHTEAVYLEGAGILAMDDKPVEVDRTIAKFLRHNRR